MKNHSRHFVAATCALAAFSPVEMMAQNNQTLSLSLQMIWGMVMWAYTAMSI